MLLVDGFSAWLIFILAEGSRKGLTSKAFGDEQTRALRPAATEVVRRTAAELCPGDGKRTEELAILVDQLFKTPVPGAPLGEQGTVLEAWQVGIAERLKVLDSPVLAATVESLTGRDVPAKIVAETLARYLVQEIMVRGSRDVRLAPVAAQLNHDVTHLQGQRHEEMLAQLIDLVTKLAEVGSAPVVPRKPVRLPPRPVLLAGREELLAELGTRLTGGGDPGSRTVVLRGMGGAGKTSVALEFAYRHVAGLSLVWQLAAEDSTALIAQFSDLAAQLGASDLLGRADPVAQVHAALAARSGGWLLIFDNARGPEDLESVLPPAGDGQVLITSQNQHWPAPIALDVPVLERGVAAGFLLERTGLAEKDAAGELAGELGGLPLALEQAAAYMQATGRSVSGYLTLFRQKRVSLLARGKPTGYRGTVATTLALAFSQLEQGPAQTVGFLRLLAFYAAEDIPLQLLFHAVQDVLGVLAADVAAELALLVDDSLAVDDAVAALRQYSLISQPRDGLVSVHRLVQNATADQLPEELAAAWRQAAAEIIESALPADPRNPEAWPVFAALLPHAQAVLSAGSDGMARIAEYLMASGSYLAAREVFRRVVKERAEIFGLGDPKTLGVRSNLAGAVGMAGDAAGARDGYAELLPLIEQLLGPEDPQTLAIRAHLATWTGEAGDAAGARDQFAQLLPIRERVLGPEHPQTVTARSHVARWTGEAGDVAEARDQYAELLPLAEQTFGDEDAEVLHQRNNLAQLTGAAGDAAGARDQFAELLPIRERVLGAEHPDTLITRANLAAWTGEAGDAAAARDQFAELLPIRERVLGAEHPDTLATRGNLAHWTGEAGDAAAARDQYAELLPIRVHVLGGRHPSTLATRANIARWTGQAGDAAAARDQYAELLPLYARVFGAEHPATLDIRENVAFFSRAASTGRPRR